MTDRKVAMNQDWVEELHGIRKLSLSILGLSTGYAALTVPMAILLEPTRWQMLVITTSGIMMTWVNRRVIREIPFYRRTFSDRRMTRAKRTVASIALIDMTSLVMSAGATTFLLLHLMDATH